MRRTVAIGIAGLLAAFLSLPAASGTIAASAPARQAAAQPAVESPVDLPNREGSLKFGVLGDFGTGKRPQYDMGAQMAKAHERFPFELVITVGDNLYGSQGPRDFQTKFEEPYKALLSAGVKFYASLGNHDEREVQRNYKLFNMDGKLYYSFKAPKQNVRFFALDSTYPDPAERAWLEKELDGSLSTVWEPLFVKYGVSVVFSGHDHFYERTKPQKDIVYFVTGSGGQLRKGNIDRGTGLTSKGFDTDQAFLMAEIDRDELFFNAISRTGAVVDSGVIRRRKQE